MMINGTAALKNSGSLNPNINCVSQVASTNGRTRKSANMPQSGEAHSKSSASAEAPATIYIICVQSLGATNHLGTGDEKTSCAR